MRLIDSILFIDFTEMVASGVSEGYLKKAKSVGASCWSFIKDPEDKRKVLIEYEPLKEKYKEMIEVKFGDPYIYVHNQVIKEFLKSDPKAVAYFTKFRTAAGAPLPPPTIKEYIQCANWLNLLIELDNNWTKYKRALGMQAKPNLYEAVIRIIQNEKIDLPKAYTRLKEKMRNYDGQHYEVIVNKRFGNDNSKKVKTDEAHALLLEMIDHHNQFDDTFIAKKYNLMAAKAGFPTITGTTVGNYRKKNSVILDAGRYGSKVYYNNSGKVQHRERPSAPMLLINSDDNDLDLYYIDITLDKNGRKKVDYQFRYVLYVIIDAYNDYILGYAIGETPNVELIKSVYRNAINHVKEITGEYYLWDALQFDRFAYSNKPKVYEGSLKQFYDMQGITLPATLKVPRGKVIEQSFGTRWHQTLKEISVSTHNYAGNNIVSKSKINEDALQLYKKDFPTKEEGLKQIHEFIYMMRNLEVTGKPGVTKQQEWLTAFNESQKSKQHILETEQRLMLFGKDHSHTNRVTNAGIVATLDEVKYVYEVPKEMYMNTLGLQVTLKYDPADPAKVLAISTDGKHRMVCEQFERFKMAPADYQEGDRTRINQAIEEKKGHGLLVSAASEDRKATLKRANMNAEAILRAGSSVPKALQYEAKRQIKEGFVPVDDDEDWRDQL